LWKFIKTFVANRIILEKAMHSFLNGYLHSLAKEAAINPCDYDFDSVENYVKAQTDYMTERVGGFAHGCCVRIG
jgi:hypothetical protein